ncbi:MAG: YraN family protein [Verrucomicrobiales bacterium]|nr:YraN family protein [Verrucomicrobiales bacterium]
MNGLFRRLYYRWIDCELDHPIAIPDFDEEESGVRNQWIGETGERLAAKTLWRNGHRVLYRNFRARGGGELDLVSRHRDTLVFSEVKTRTSDQFGRPADAVDQEKQRLIIRGANAWLRELNHPEILFRFDVIEVLLLKDEVPEVRVNEGAFSSPQVGLGM